MRVNESIKCYSTLILNAICTSVSLYLTLTDFATVKKKKIMKWWFKNKLQNVEPQLSPEKHCALCAIGRTSPVHVAAGVSGVSTEILDSRRWEPRRTKIWKGCFEDLHEHSWRWLPAHQ